jgi:hypothetical protein
MFDKWFLKIGTGKFGSGLAGFLGAWNSCGSWSSVTGNRFTFWSPWPCVPNWTAREFRMLVKTNNYPRK